MGHRLSKIYTRTGDSGETGLGDGSRVRKDDLRVEAYGTVDELNSALGCLLAEGLPEGLEAQLSRVQHQLFDLGGELSVPGYRVIDDADVQALEGVLDEHNAELEPLKDFILPGGGRAASLCHLARAICRRAERRLVTLVAEEPEINPASVRYLNRLSDLLFVVARKLAIESGHGEVLWDPKKR